jgi:L-rhamnose mutarotase
MERVAFKMKVFPGCEQEYKRRHDLIWPELKGLLKEAGIFDYSIFIDAETNSLFAYLTVADKGKLSELSSFDVMKRWWDYMKDIMETNPDGSPLTTPLNEVFYLP